MTHAIRPLSPVIGSEITGLDLSRPLPDGDFDAVRRALETTSLLVIRDQHLTPEAHIAFSRRFGPLEIHVQHRFHLAGHPEILVVSNVIEKGEPIGLADAGRYWHSDLSYMREPSLGSLLHAQELPAEGGDTLFVSMHAAYDALPADIKRRIDTLEAVHDYAARNAKQTAASPLRPTLTPEMAAKVPPAVQPVVRLHPATGRPALFVNEGFTTHIVGMPAAESEALLALLFDHMVKPDFQYRHRWRGHDLVMWDNRATIHLATGCPPELRRTLYRTTVRGDLPIGPAAAHRRSYEAIGAS
jgi:taurine dioxygenase